MRIYFIVITFIITLNASAQNVEKDFDAIDSLYREDQFYFNLTYNTLQSRPDGLKQNKLSPGIALGFLRDMPLNKKRTFSLAAGLGYSLSIYNQNLGVFEENNLYTYQLLNSESASFSKNRLTLHYIDLPIELRWRNSTPESHKFWRIHLGVKLSYLFYDKYKIESSQVNNELSNLNDFNDFHYGIYLTTGWNTWNIYAYYGLNPLFKSSAKIDGQAIDIKTLNLGLMFYIL